VSSDRRSAQIDTRQSPLGIGGKEGQDGRDAMARLVVIYKTPKDAAAFDKHYFGTHIPLAKKIPGLRKYEVSQGPVATPSGPSGFHLVATLHFDDMTAIQKAFASAEGQATAADVQTFTSDPPHMLLFDIHEV
jgi:uncharacterized protein (TIGR02118 family)